MHDYLNNVRVKLGEAVETLASGSAPLKQRLYDSYQILSPLDPAHLIDEHEDVAQGLEGLKNAFTWLPVDPEHPDRGTLYGTLNTLSKEEAVLLAQRVVSFYDDVSRACYRQEP